MPNFFLRNEKMKKYLSQAKNFYLRNQNKFLVGSVAMLPLMAHAEGELLDVAVIVAKIGLVPAFIIALGVSILSVVATYTGIKYMLSYAKKM
jgi:hypothetical protein